MALVKVGKLGAMEATIKAEVKGERSPIKLRISTSFNEVIITLTEKEQFNLNKDIAINFNKA